MNRRSFLTAASYAALLAAGPSYGAPRSRVPAAVVPATVAGGLQLAMDQASNGYDIEGPFSWWEQGNVGYRSNGVTVIQMAPAPSNAPYLLPQPVFLDGPGSSGPIVLRGDPANPLAYNVYANNSLQGITAQHGAHLILEGFTIRGDANCTLVNGLRGGYISTRNVWYGPALNGGLNAPIGAAGGSQVDLIGPNVLIGAGFLAVLSCIENGRIILAPGHSISLHNNMNFGIMVNMVYGSCWTQGTPPVFNGAGLAGSTGVKYAAHYNSFIGFDKNLIPGAPGTSDATSTVM